MQVIQGNLRRTYHTENFCSLTTLASVFGDSAKLIRDGESMGLHGNSSRRGCSAGGGKLRESRQSGNHGNCKGDGVLRGFQGTRRIPLILSSRATKRVARIAHLVILVASTPSAHAEVVFANGRIIDSYANGAYSISAADLDHDGDLDLLVSESLDYHLLWYQNLDGLGTFSDSIELSPYGGSPRSAFGVDLNGDGRMDVLATLYITDSVVWYEGIDGEGTFSEARYIASDANGVLSAIAVDIDDDGDLDVVSASFVDDSVRWYENNGIGNFTSMSISSTADGANHVAAADLDGDGDQDVVSVSFSDDRVVWYENTNGQGVFSTGTDITDAANGATYVSLADIDGDNDVDVLVASGNDDRFILFTNDGDGNFNSGLDLATIDEAVSINVADLDGDGDLDVVACGEAGSILWLENTDGKGTFSTALMVADEPGARDVIAVDLDGDDDLDLVAVIYDADRVIWYENLGDGTSSDQDPSTSSDAPTAPPSPAITPAPSVSPSPKITPAPSVSPSPKITPSPVHSSTTVATPSPASAYMTGTEAPVDLTDDSTYSGTTSLSASRAPAPTPYPGGTSPTEIPASGPETGVQAETEAPVTDTNPSETEEGDESRGEWVIWETVVAVIGSVAGAIVAGALGCYFKNSCG